MSPETDVCCTNSVGGFKLVHPQVMSEKAQELILHISMQNFQKLCGYGPLVARGTASFHQVSDRDMRR